MKLIRVEGAAAYETPHVGGLALVGDQLVKLVGFGVFLFHFVLGLPVAHGQAIGSLRLFVVLEKWWVPWSQMYVAEMSV